jgi:NADPH:quinone reductase
MQAQVINSFGDPSVFTLTNIPRPTIKSGHVLIRVHATSVNPIDCKIRSGQVANSSPDFPAVLHGDVSGVIEEIAADVTEFAVGDEVYGCAGGVKVSGGALAEFMLADARLLAKNPKSLSMLEAAAIPLVGITAWDGLFKKANLKSGMHVLIHGGVGGVGHVAIQLAKWCGATVAATVTKTEDFIVAKAFGADEVINAKQEMVEEYVQRLTYGNGFDVVFDTVGGTNLDKSFAAVAINGTVVTTLARSIHDLTPLHAKSASLHVVFMLLPLITVKSREEHGEILTQMAAIVDAGKLKPLLDPNQFKLQTVQDAHTLLESGKAHGKVAVSII